eukprot:4981288-Prorocentrum_lima.AAC.1
MKQGIVMNMYNRKYRWTGTHDIVDLMAWTNILSINGVTSRLLQTYRALAVLPGGVPFDEIW